MGSVRVAGAIGQVGVDNTVVDNEKWAKAIEYFNGAINVVGLKNLGKGLVFSAEAFSNAIKENSNLKSVILAKYTSWQAEIKDLGKLADVEQQLVTKQEKVWKMLGSVKNAVKISFKEGDEIAGKTIIKVRQGTNGKIAIIGRKMEGHVKEVAAKLRGEGYKVEILDDDFISPIEVDGKEWTVDAALNDMKNNEFYDKYRDDNKYIKKEYLDKIPMYKMNKKWIEKLNDENWTILDMGYPQDETSESHFYDMELNLVKW